MLGYEVRAVARKIQKRAYRGRPAREETEVSFEIEVTREAGAIQERKREMGEMARMRIRIWLESLTQLGLSSRLGTPACTMRL